MKGWINPKKWDRLSRTDQLFVIIYVQLLLEWIWLRQIIIPTFLLGSMSLLGVIVSTIFVLILAKPSMMMTAMGIGAMASIYVIGKLAQIVIRPAK